ncbi:MAG: hypothetical protein ACJ8GN_14660 [Longimicrobiaceae bacterium]
MDETLHATLAGWGNFYLITGTAAAALTGLQFVVQTLIASGAHRGSMDDPEAGTAAFGTPTVVHFALALVVSALLCVPWPGYASLRATLVVLGAGALAYSALVLRRARGQRIYVPVAEDWIWHIILPSAAYAAVLVAALLFHEGVEGPLFAIAAATVLLLCAGIHNAWDTVTYLTFNALRSGGPAGEAPPPRRSEPARRGRRRR